MHQPTNWSWVEWLGLALGAAFLWLVWFIDEWREKAGYRVEPAPYVGLGTPTTLQQKVAADADKQHEHAGRDHG